MRRPERAGGAGFAAALPTSNLFDLLAVRLDAEKAAGTTLRLGFAFPDRKESVTVTVASGVLIHRPGLTQGLDAILTVKRSDLVAALLGGAPLASKIVSGEASIDGDVTAFIRFIALQAAPDPAFPIVTR